MASPTDKLRYASGSTRPIVTTLSLPKAFGATTASLTSATGWNTTTGLDYVMYRRQLNSTTGKYEEVAGTRIEGRATLTGTTLSGMTFDAGTEPAAGYAADGNTVVLCGATAQWADDLIETLLTLFNQDQTLKPGPIQTALGLGAGALNGWNALGYTFSTVTDNGNGSYDCVVNGQDVTGIFSEGMRGRTTRTVAAPTQCASLNGTSNYFSKSTPAGMAQTDSITESIWIKPDQYKTAGMISRNNGTTDGWKFYLNSSGQVVLAGARAADDLVTSNQSVPLNKWTHISASINTTTTTGVITFNGFSVPVTYTNNANTGFLTPTQSYLIGATNGASPTDFFSGKLAQAASYSAVISVANILARRNQTMAGTETSLISAYSLSNVITDLNTTSANNLLNNGTTSITNADAPWGGQAGGTISSTLDYFIVQKKAFSTNTTLTVQVPEGCTIPTSGGVASVVYSSTAAPYGFPKQRGKWEVGSYIKIQYSQSSPVSGTWYNLGSWQLNLPIGEWSLSHSSIHGINGSSSTTLTCYSTLSSSSSSETDPELTAEDYRTSLQTSLFNSYRRKNVSVSAATVWYALYKGTSFGTAPSLLLWEAGGVLAIVAENAYL